MIFETRTNRRKNQRICINYGIDYEKYKQQIDAIPQREFSAKINYLNDQQIPITTEGNLHPIFCMSSINMQVRYGISLETLITEYSAIKDKVKII